MDRNSRFAVGILLASVTIFYFETTSIAAAGGKNPIALTPAPIVTAATSRAAHKSAPNSALNSVGARSDVIRVRIGTHSDKTRMVLDLTGPAEFAHRMEDGGRTLRMDMPGVRWRSPNRSKSCDCGAIARYEFSRSQAGTGHLVIKTSAAKTVKRMFLLGPEGKYGHRIVLDLIDAPVSIAEAERPQNTGLARMISRGFSDARLLTHEDARQPGESVADGMTPRRQDRREIRRLIQGGISNVSSPRPATRSIQPSPPIEAGTKKNDSVRRPIEPSGPGQ